MLKGLYKDNMLAIYGKRLIILAVIALSVPTRHTVAASFWPETATPLSEQEVESLIRSSRVSTDGDVIIIDDMAFPKERLTRAGFSARRWPNARLIYDATALSKTQRQNFLKGCKMWEDVSDVRCVERKDEKSGYIRIIKVEGDTSSAGVGYPGEGFISRMKLCCFENTRHVAHEIGHALGLTHEHQRSDRDGFVKILTENLVDDDYESQFEKKTTNNYGTYDFLSILHYRDNARAKRGKKTILALPPNESMQTFMGKAKNLSELDKRGMQERYKTAR